MPVDRRTLLGAGAMGIGAAALGGPPVHERPGARRLQHHLYLLPLGGDGLDIAVWLHRRTEESFLLDLASKMHTPGANWTGATPSRHNVNIAQGFREPAQYAQVTGFAGPQVRRGGR